MSKLIVLEVPGLTMEMVQRGDSAAHLFDLIAEGALAECDGLPPRIGEWITDASPLRVIDGRIRELRSRGELAIVSEAVFIHPRPIKGLRPGARLTSQEVAGHLREIVDGP
jgi:hypothetical protein